MNVHVKSYDRKLKIYSNGLVKETKYKRSIICDKQENESDEIVSKGRVSSSIEKEFKEVRSDSLSRTRNLLIDYACENESDFKSFITLTFAENVTDINEANKKFDIWRTKITKVLKDKNISFKYLGVPEFQNRGAVHYHLLTNLEVNGDYLTLQHGKENMYDVKYWKYGFSSAFDIMRNTDDNFNIALYICKYLYKDIDNRLFGRNKCLKSNNLKKPLISNLEASSDTYKIAKSYIESKGYNLCDYYRFDGNEDNSYLIPYELYTYKSQCDNIILKDLLQVK